MTTGIKETAIGHLRSENGKTMLVRSAQRFHSPLSSSNRCIIIIASLPGRKGAARRLREASLNLKSFKQPAPFLTRSQLVHYEHKRAVLLLKFCDETSKPMTIQLSWPLQACLVVNLLTKLEHCAHFLTTTAIFDNHGYGVGLCCTERAKKTYTNLLTDCSQTES